MEREPLAVGIHTERTASTAAMLLLRAKVTGPLCRVLATDGTACHHTRSHRKASKLSPHDDVGLLVGF